MFKYVTLLIIAVLFCAGCQCSYGAVGLGGDFRYRHETTLNSEQDSTQHQLRARLNLDGFSNDHFSSHLRFGTSVSPTSSSQGLNGNSEPFSVSLEQAYIRYSVTEELGLNAGKFGSPFYSLSTLLWDPDLNLEGISGSINQNGRFLSGGGFWVDGHSSTRENGLFVAQLGFNDNMTTRFNGSFGYVYFTQVDNRIDYGLADFNASYNLVPDRKWIVYGDFVRNSQETDRNNAFAVGTSLQLGEFNLGYQYRDVEALSVYQSWTDDEYSSGLGDFSAHNFRCRLEPFVNTYLQGQYFNRTDNSNDETNQTVLVDFGLEF
jgi:hypothetical protein